MTDPNDPYGDPYRNDDEHQPDAGDPTPPPTPDDGTPDPYDLAEPVTPASDMPPPPPMPDQAAPQGMSCQHCQHDLTGATLGGNCPQCGAPIVSTGYSHAQSSSKAVTSLVLGIISIPTCLCCGLLGVILGPLAIYFGKQAQREIAEGTASQGSEGMAKAGLICGIVGTALGAVSIILGVLGQVIPLLTNP